MECGHAGDLERAYGLGLSVSNSSSSSSIESLHYEMTSQLNRHAVCVYYGLPCLGTSANDANCNGLLQARRQQQKTFYRPPPAKHFRGPSGEEIIFLFKMVHSGDGGAPQTARDPG